MPEPRCVIKGCEDEPTVEITIEVIIDPDRPGSPTTARICQDHLDLIQGGVPRHVSIAMPDG